MSELRGVAVYTIQVPQLLQRDHPSSPILRERVTLRLNFTLKDYVSRNGPLDGGMVIL